MEWVWKTVWINKLQDPDKDWITNAVWPLWLYHHAVSPLTYRDNKLRSPQHREGPGCLPFHHTGSGCNTGPPHSSWHCTESWRTGRCWIELNIQFEQILNITEHLHFPPLSRFQIALLLILLLSDVCKCKSKKKSTRSTNNFLVSMIDLKGKSNVTLTITDTSGRKVCLLITSLGAIRNTMWTLLFDSEDPGQTLRAT